MYSVKVFLCFVVIIAVCELKTAVRKKTRLEEFYESAEVVMMAVDPYEYIVYKNENLPKMVKNLYVTMLTEMTIFFYKSDIKQPVILNFTSSFNESHYFQFKIDPKTWTSKGAMKYVQEDGEMTKFVACFLGPVCDKNPVPLVSPFDNLEIYGPDAPALLRIFINGINVRRNKHPNLNRSIKVHNYKKVFNLTSNGRQEFTCMLQFNYNLFNFWSDQFRYEPVKIYNGNSDKARLTLVALRYFVFVVYIDKYGHYPEKTVFLPFKDAVVHALAKGKPVKTIKIQADAIHAFQCDDEGEPFFGEPL